MRINVSRRPTSFRVGEIAELGATQLVRGAMLVQQPRDLVCMAGEIRRELRRNHEIDRLSVALTQIDQTPRRRVRQHLAFRIPLERNADELGRVPVLLQLGDERSHQVLGTTPHERDLASQTMTRWIPIDAEAHILTRIDFANNSCTISRGRDALTCQG